ncbi:MAG: GldG family protein [Spirochaetales bacterium]|nr:GldG family protein [Spirochaetales bacterium]
MNKKKQTLIITFMFIAVLILVAMNSTIFSARLDITETKVYTIQESSKKIMRRLPDQLTITYFLAEKLKTSNVIFRQIEDILKEYAASSEGKVKLTVLDPGSSAEIENQARSNGIYIWDAGEKSGKDSAYVFLAASGLLIEYQDKKIPIARIQSIETLEYNLTAFILSIIENKKKTVGYIINKPNWNNSTFQSVLQSEFEPAITAEMFNPGESIPDSIDALFIVGTPDFTESELFEIDQYIMRGGKAFFSIDSVFIMQQQGQAIPHMDSNLVTMLEQYGAKIPPALVMEGDDAFAPIHDGRQSYVYNYFFRTFAEYASKENPITANFAPVVFEWASPIELVPPVGVKAEPLTSSSAASVRVQDQLDINPQNSANLYQTLSPSAASQPLVVALSGSFPSFFQGRELPESKKDSGVNAVYNSIPSRIIVVGSSNFIDPATIDLMGLQGSNYYWSNFSYFKTCIEWLTNSEDLIAIKTRASRDSSLSKIQKPEEAEAAAGFATYFNLIIIPLLVVLFGIIKYMLRKKAKNE